MRTLISGQVPESPDVIWSVDLQYCSVQPFGPSAGQAELAGGFNPFSYDSLNHWRVGFRSSGMFRAGLARNKGLSRFKATCGFTSYRLIIADELLESDYPLGKIQSFDVRLSASLKVAGKREMPGGLHAGFFVSSAFSADHIIYDNARWMFQVKELEESVSWHWGCEFEYLWSTGRPGPYFGFNSWITMPGSVGEMARLHMSEGSWHQTLNNRIRYYAFGMGVTMGVAF